MMIPPAQALTTGGNQPGESPGDRTHELDVRAADLPDDMAEVVLFRFAENILDIICWKRSPTPAH